MAKLTVSRYWSMVVNSLFSYDLVADGEGQQKPFVVILYVKYAVNGFSGGFTDDLLGDMDSIVPYRCSLRCSPDSRWRSGRGSEDPPAHKIEYWPGSCPVAFSVP